MRVEHYLTTDGKDLVTDWLRSLRDMQGKKAIVRRIDRIVCGNLGNHSFCREGVWELRIDTGPGYRVYFGRDGNTLVLLLCCGDKSSQSRDIDRAVTLYVEYTTRKSHEHATYTPAR